VLGKKLNSNFIILRFEIICRFRELVKIYFLGLMNQPLEGVDGQKGTTNASSHYKTIPFVRKQI